MNIYDDLNKLMASVRASQEFKAMSAARDKIKDDKDAKRMINDYLTKSQEIQMARYQGKEPDKKDEEIVSKLQNTLMLNPDAANYLMCYIRFQMILEDISKELSQVIKDAVGEDDGAK